jgi:hypothetical protein
VRLPPAPLTPEDFAIWHRGEPCTDLWRYWAWLEGCCQAADRHDAELMLILRRAADRTNWVVTAGPVEGLLGGLWEPVMGRPLWAKYLGIRA